MARFLWVAWWMERYQYFWERSPLLESMLNSSHSLIDHSFIIDDEIFHELYYLVDGIHPWLSRFMSTISVPTTVVDSNFLKWQESKRKDIECVWDFEIKVPLSETSNFDASP